MTPEPSPEPPDEAPLWDVPRASAAMPPSAPTAPFSSTLPPLTPSPTAGPAPSAWAPPVQVSASAGEEASLPTFGPAPSGVRSMGAAPPPAEAMAPPEIVPVPPAEVPVDAPRLPGVPSTFDLDDLIESLNTAGRIVPHDDPNASPPPEGLDTDSADEVVSPTLARIFAAQGQYADAIRAYERLATVHPDRAADFLAEADALRTRSR